MFDDDVFLDKAGRVGALVVGTTVAVFGLWVCFVFTVALTRLVFGL